MTARRFAVLALGFAAFGLAASPVGTAALAPVPDGRSSGFDVHEWGTFTSVAGEDGQAVPWSPLSGPSDLPCFVRMLTPDSIKYSRDWLTAIRATVRMETPVIYFYAASPVSARVDVGFSQGLITEWYPQAAVPRPALPIDFAQTTGAASWAKVDIRPGATETFPTEAARSHYYAARATDAAPVRVNGQDEKFLFYRGIASFPIALTATVESDGAVRLVNDGPALGTVLLFDGDGQRLGYRVARGVSGEARLERPALTGRFSALAAELEQVLVAEGLFPREARAMIETWRDSWFESGTRLIYIVPRETVDRILPLTIDPAPSSIARAFVGRLELFRPEALDAMAAAIANRDVRTIARFGRFAEPMAQRVSARLPNTDAAALLQEASRWQVTDLQSCGGSGV